MSSSTAPATLDELVDLVRTTPRVLAVGSGTKPRPATAPPGYTPVSLRRWSGIQDYDPGEFTVTALAGTPIRDLAATLADHGQYLPFDPLLVDAGATLGGTVAAGCAGPGRLRFGGIRDFILGVRMVDGDGRLLRLGGKVVKNAAGFDVPKFLVGSAGRFGVLAEITCKVFPRPAADLTLRLAFETAAQAASAVMDLARGRWEFEALDIPPDSTDVLARLAGPSAALGDLAADVLRRWPGRQLAPDEARLTWNSLREVAWCSPADLWIKAAVTPPRIPGLTTRLSAIAGARVHFSTAGNTAWIALPSPTAVPTLDALLREQGVPAQTLRGDAPLRLGQRSAPGIAHAVKAALDPTGRFPSLDD